MKKHFTKSFAAVLMLSMFASALIPALAADSRYPQEFSYQEPGEIPEITIPELVEQDGIEMWVNGVKKECDTPFVLEDGTMYFPYEWLMEAMGDDGKGYYLSKKNSTITRNGKTVTLNNPVKKAEDGTIFVPAQFIAEAYDAKVWLDEAHQMLIVTTGSQKDDDILRSNAHVFIMNGEPYYEISFNKFDLFWQISSDAIYNNGIYPEPDFFNAEGCIIAAEEALSQLHEHGFKSIRVFCYNINLTRSQEEVDRFWAATDKMYDLCDKYDIKVVACLCLMNKDSFTPGTYEGNTWVCTEESMYDYITNPESKSRKNAYDFLDAYVSRYKDRKTILMWEIQNESNLEVDSGHLTGKITYSALQQGELFSDLANRIRMNDPERLVTTGDSKISNDQWSKFQVTMSGSGGGNSTVPTLNERLKALILLNKGMDVMSIHGYNVGYSEMYTDPYGMRTKVDWDLYLEEAKRLGIPLYNGETGGSLVSVGTGSPTSDLMNNTYPNAHIYRENYLNKMIEAGVQLSHWWTFHSDRSVQNYDRDTWSIRVDDETSETFFVVKAANEKLKATYLVNPLSAENTDELGEVPEGFVQDLTEVETDPVETEPATEPESTPETTPETTPKTTPSGNGGCKSAVTLILPTVVMMAALPVVIKKRKS